MSRRCVLYSVRVDVVELANVRFLEDSKDILPNPYVEVLVCGQSKSTPRRQQVSSTTFNCQFDFNVALNKQDFNICQVNVAAYHAYMFSSGLIGKATFSFPFIYSKAQHWLYRQWVALRHEERPADNVGFILVTVGVFGPADSVPIAEDVVVGGPLALAAGSTENEEPADGIQEVSRHPRVPEIKFQFFTIAVSVYRAQDLLFRHEDFVASGFCIRVSHNGVSECTKVLTSSSPDWNSTICLPGWLPFFDDTIILELCSGDRNKSRLAVALLTFSQLMKEHIEVSWINFYWKPPPAGVLANLAQWGSWLGGTEFMEPTEYAGRVLIAATVTKTQVPSLKGVRTSSTARESVVAEYVVFVDVYEVTSTRGSEGIIQVKVAIGPHTVSTNHVYFGDNSYLLDSTVGRLEPLKIFVPPVAEAYDIFIYVYGGSAGATVFGATGALTQRLAFTRISFRSTRGSNSTPSWRILESTETGEEMFSVLLTISSELVSNAPQRAPRLKYDLRSYLMRAKIYEGLNMPCFSTTKFPSAYVKLDVGGQTLTTTSVPDCLCPTWYQSFEIKVSLPRNLSLAPDLMVEVLSPSDSFLGGVISLGMFSFPIVKMPLTWIGPPQWFNLRRGPNSALKHHKGKILCSFELVPANQVDYYPFEEDILPPTRPCRLELFFVGVRLFQPLRNPSASVAYLPHTNTQEGPLWKHSFDVATTGRDASWNFLQLASANHVELPSSEIHNCILELTITDAVQGFSGEAQNFVGTAIISLTQLLPWLDPLDASTAATTFAITTLEEELVGTPDGVPATSETVGVGGEEGETGAPPEPLRSKISSSSGEEVRDLLQSAANETSLRAGAETMRSKAGFVVQIPYNDPDAANVQRYEFPGDYCAIDEDEERCKEQQLLAQHGCPQGKATPSTRGSKKRRMGSQNMTKSSSKTATVDVEANILGRGSNYHIMNFELTLPDEEDIKEEERRQEITHELEADIGNELLPYVSVPILRSTPSGLPEIVGYAKIICTVLDESSKSSKHREQEFKTSVDWLIQRYATLADLVVRVYIISAKGLVVPSGSTNPAVYVWIHCGPDTNKASGLPHEIRDSQNLRKQGLRPDFNKCYVLHCAIPDYCMLTITLVNAAGLTEEIIGSTHVDLEDRWFNPKYQYLMSKDTVPIELRILRRVSYAVSQGRVRTWIELMTSETAQSKPLAVLASPDPEHFQLRVVIWKCKGVPMDDDTSVSFYVRGTYQVDEANCSSRETDTHYNSRDGTGIFNWRFVWNIFIPAKFPALKFQIHHSSFLQRVEPIGESDVDLSYDLSAARKLRSSSQYQIPATWYNCYHPGHPGKVRGSIYVEVSLLALRAAELAPVGQGRDDPNRNPYLEPVTENRTYVDWKQIGEAVSATAGAIMSSAKYGLVIFAVIAVIGGILFLVILLK